MLPILVLLMMLSVDNAAVEAKGGPPGYQCHDWPVGGETSSALLLRPALLLQLLLLVLLLPVGSSSPDWSLLLGSGGSAGC